MANIIPPGYAQAEWVFSLVGDSERMIVTCGYDMDTHTDGQDLADQLRTDFVAGFPVASIVDDYALEGITVRVGQDGAPPIVFENTTRHAGTATGFEVLPQNCALLVHKRTALGGRRGRGRFYLPPFCENEGDVSAAGVIGSGGVTAIQTKISLAWRLDRGAVLLHGDSPSPLVPTPITNGFTLDSRIASQRRRLRR